MLCFSFSFSLPLPSKKTIRKQTFSFASIFRNQYSQVKPKQIPILFTLNKNNKTLLFAKSNWLAFEFFISRTESEQSATVSVVRWVPEGRLRRVIHLAKWRCNWRNVEIGDVGAVVGVVIESFWLVERSEFRHRVESGEARPIGIYRVRRNFKIELVNVVLLQCWFWVCEEIFPHLRERLDDLVDVGRRRRRRTVAVFFTWITLRRLLTTRILLVYPT